MDTVVAMTALYEFILENKLPDQISNILSMNISSVGFEGD